MNDPSCLKSQIRDCLKQLHAAEEGERHMQPEWPNLFLLISIVTAQYTRDLPNEAEDIANECADYIYRELDRIMERSSERGHNPESAVYYKIRELAREARAEKGGRVSLDSMEGCADGATEPQLFEFDAIDKFCQYLKQQAFDRRVISLVRALSAGKGVETAADEIGISRATAFRLFGHARPSLARAYKSFF